MKLAQLGRGRPDLLEPGVAVFGAELASLVLEDGRVLIATESSLIVSTAPTHQLEMTLYDWRSLHIGLGITTGMLDAFHPRDLAVAGGWIRISELNVAAIRAKDQESMTEFDEFWKVCLEHRAQS